MNSVLLSYINNIFIYICALECDQGHKQIYFLSKCAGKIIQLIELKLESSHVNA